MEKQILEKVLEAFEQNASIGILHVTSDGQCFRTPNEARLHARSLENERVLPLTKAVVENLLNPKAEEPEQEPTAEEKIKAEVGAMTVAALKERLMTDFAKSEDELKGLTKAPLAEMLLTNMLEAHAAKNQSDQ